MFRHLILNEITIGQTTHTVHIEEIVLPATHYNALLSVDIFICDTLERHVDSATNVYKYWSTAVIAYY